jgi:hypothetical protein
VDAGGNVASFGLGATAFDTSNIRSATSTNGVDMWAAGNSGTAGNGGTWYNNGTAATQISSTQNNSRVVSVQNNTLFYSSGSGAGAAIGINSLGSPPPTSGPVSPSAFLNGVTGQLAAPMEFALSPGPISAGSFLYLTDQAAAATAVQRFNFDGTSWTLAYNFSGATTTSGVAVDFSGPSPVIYATAPTGLFTAIDAGVAGTLTSIATPGANFAFRGVAFAPVPEPAHVFLLCAAAAGAVHCWRRRKATAQTAAM